LQENDIKHKQTDRSDYKYNYDHLGVYDLLIIFFLQTEPYIKQKIKANYQTKYQKRRILKWKHSERSQAGEAFIKWHEKF